MAAALDWFGGWPALARIAVGFALNAGAVAGVSFMVSDYVAVRSVGLLDSRIVGLDGHVAAVGGDLGAVHGAVASLQAAVAADGAKVEALTAAVGEVGRTLPTMLAAMEDRLARTSSGVESGLRATVAETDGDLKALIAATDARLREDRKAADERVEALLARAESRLDAASDRLNTVGGKLDAASDRLDTANAKLDTASDRLDTAREQLTRDVSQTRAAQQALQVRLDQFAWMVGMMPAPGSGKAEIPASGVSSEGKLPPELADRLTREGGVGRVVIRKGVPRATGEPATEDAAPNPQ